MPAESNGVIQERVQEENRQEAYQPKKEWAEMTLFHKKRLQLAIQARNAPDRKFDNLTFVQDFYSNEDAANSYLRPKKNDDEVRVVGGTTEKRIESVVNELQSMNYQHEVQSYDNDDKEIYGLGKAMETCVTRTNQLEGHDEITADAIWELVTQRAVFVEEILETKRVGDSVQRRCRKRVRSSLEVIIGDPTMGWYMLQEQPFIATYDRMSIRTAQMFFGHYANWKYVRGGQDLSVDVYGVDLTFRLGILQTDEVEVIRYMSVPDNEYQIYVNGVPMLEPGTELPFQYPFPRYPLAVAIPKRMGHHTFWGRSMASALKYLQALSDETVRNVVRKFRQAVEPPRAVKSTERIFTRDIYTAGKISYGVDADVIKPLTSHSGVTEAEMTMLNTVKGLQDELASRSDAQLGVTPKKKQSATAVVEQQKQAIKMLGQLVLAYSSLVRQMTENRIYNIIESFAEPDDRDFDPSQKAFVEKFRRFTLKDQPLENGRSGDKIVQFMGRDLSDEEYEGIKDWEEKQEEEGRPVRLSVVNVKRLRKMSVMWFVTVASKPKEDDDLHKLMFQDKFSQAQGIAQAIKRELNAERVISEYEQTWKADDWFKEPEPPSMPPMPQEQGGEEPQGGEGGEQPKIDDSMSGTGLGGDLTQGLRTGTRKPEMPSAKPKALVGAA